MEPVHIYLSLLKYLLRFCCEKHEIVTFPKKIVSFLLFFFASISNLFIFASA